MSKDLTRKQLYNLVWKKPITQIAKEYGLSDRGLGKLCEREGIPTPPRGYWAKIKSGQKIKKPPLLMPKSSSRTILSEDSTVVNNKQEKQKESPLALKELIEYEEDIENKIVVPEKIKTHHSVVKKYQIHRKKWNNKSSNKINNRIDKIFSCFLYALEHRNYVVDEDSSFHKTKIVSGEEFALVGISEHIKRTRRETTEEERATSYYGKWTYDETSTELLELSIYDSYGHKIKRIVETETNPIEDSLNKAMIIIHKEIIEERERKLYWEEERRKSFERQERISKEKDKRESLIVQASDWHKAKKIRDYVEAIKQNNTGNNEISYWAKWALDYADIVDPTISKEDTLLQSDY